MPGLPRTALVVAVPEAGPVVGALRRRLDAHAALGVPAHVTVLFPFVPADEADTVLDRLATLFAGVPPIRYSFSRTRWFGDDVVWLAPDEDAPFRDLTARVHAAFPAHPPFEGAFDDVVPHLTIGHGCPREVLEAAERQVLPSLPVTGTAREVLLLAEDDAGRWHRRAALPLSG